MRRIIRAIEFGPGRDDIDGLAECLLPDLDSIVILSGRNGSGKTRIINAIKSKLEWATEQGASLGNEPNGYWEYWHTNRRTLQELAAKDPQGLSVGRRQELDRLKKELASCPAFKFDPSLNPANIKVVELFAPQEPNFSDPIDLSERRRTQLRERLNGSENLLLESESSLEYLDTIARDYIKSTYLAPSGGAERIQVLSHRYQRVAQAIEKHLAISLGFQGFEPTLDGNPLTVATKRLSTGQKYLLDFWVRVSNHGQFNEPTLILMDEPELHVHPAALVPVFSAIFEKWTNAQIFVATHCVPLIARLGFERVLWVNLGRVQRARNVIDQLLISLLGGDGGVERLRHLTLEPDRLAALTFAAECLLPPKVLEGEKQDPQAHQFMQFLSRKYENAGKPIRLLDWGAGKARLLRCLGFEEGFDVRSSLSYFALEKDDEEAEASSVNIADVFGSSEKRLFKEFSEVVSAYGVGYFDICVLCNVLHEIHPDEWLDLFSDIKRALGDGGFLLIIEDGELPHGERAHRDGFLLLDGDAVQALFQLSSPPENIPAADPKYADRLQAFVLPKEKLNPSHESLAKAINCVRRTSLAKLEGLRPEGYRDGSIRSLYVEQFYNASRLLMSLGIEPPFSVEQARLLVRAPDQVSR